MRVADAIFERIKQETDTVYFVPGGGAMYLVDALGRSGLRAVSAIHEQGAGYMAIGHAMATGRLGVCLVTSGPGATNAVSACLAAWTDSVPVLFISGQAHSKSLVGDSGLRTRGVQEAPTIEIVKPITKYAFEPMDKSGDSTIAMVDKLIQICKSGRPGPCWLSVPLDVQGAEL